MDITKIIDRVNRENQENVEDRAEQLVKEILSLSARKAEAIKSYDETIAELKAELTALELPASLSVTDILGNS